MTSTNTAPSFGAGGSGKLTIDSGGDDFGHNVALQSDGKILLAGAIDDNFALLRFNANGTLDTSFAGGGKVTTDMGGSDGGHGIALQADGRIVVAGEVHVVNLDTNYGLVRYNADGSLDTSFAGSGKLITDFSGSRNGISEKANNVMLQTDGKILAAGSYSIDNNTSSSGGFALARYNADGSLDTSFDGDGKLTTNFGGDGDGRGIALQPDGRILVVGNSYIGGVDKNDFALARYNTDGSLDTSFDGDGKVTTDFGGADYGPSVALQPDGKVLVGGTSFIGSNNFALARYNTNGSLDTSFDGDGKVTIDFGGSDNGFSIAVQPDGKILVAGTSNGDFALTRYNTDGSLDTSFAGDGKLTTDFGATDESYSLRLQSDGKILVAGTSYNGSGVGDFALARYNPDGSMDTSFGSGGSNTLDATPTYTRGGAAVVLDNSVHLVDTELAAQGNYAGATLTLSRHGGANAQDSFSAGDILGGLTPGADLSYAGTSIGSVTANANGVLTLSFNANATQARVDGTLSSIAYTNSSSASPASVQIDWNFSDGNTGSQGSGGALAATGSTTVQITGTSQPPSGTSGNDTLNGSAGNETLDGGTGIDTLVYTGIRSHYTITKTATGYTVTDSSGTDGTDTLVNVERLQFADAKVAVDTSGTGGEAYRLYQAAFNRTPDIGGLGFQMKALDDGWPLATVAQNFIDSPEFSATYGALNTSGFVAQMYLNVLHRAGDPVNEIPWYATRIDSGAMSRAAVLVGFSESPENQAAVIGVIQNGMTYTV